MGLSPVLASLVSTEIAESIEWRQAPLKRCLTMIRQEDSYALFEDNKRRIEKWCDDHRRMFRGDDGPPGWSEMTEADKREMNGCVGRLITEFESARTAQNHRRHLRYGENDSIRQSAMLSRGEKHERPPGMTRREFITLLGVNRQPLLFLERRVAHRQT